MKNVGRNYKSGNDKGKNIIHLHNSKDENFNRRKNREGKWGGGGGRRDF